MDEFLPVSKQIQLLFEERRHPETDEPYTLQHISQQIDVSLPTLSQLRSGKIANPQLHTLREICRVFDVPLHYFETRTVEECYAILHGDTMEADDNTTGIAFRLTSLSDESKEDVLKIMQWIQAAEKYWLEHPESDFSQYPHLQDYGNESK